MKNRIKNVAGTGGIAVIELIEKIIACPVHGVYEQFFFTLEVLIQASLGNPGILRYIAYVSLPSPRKGKVSPAAFLCVFTVVLKSSITV